MWGTLVAILGTTIAVSLLLAKARRKSRRRKATVRRESERRGATPKAIRERKIDVGIGTFFSNFVMYFIILTTALTLNKSRPDAHRNVAPGRGGPASPRGKLRRAALHAGRHRHGILCIPRSPVPPRMPLRIRSAGARDWMRISRARAFSTSPFSPRSPSASARPAQDQSHQGALLDGDRQRPAGAFPFGRDSNHRVRPLDHASNSRARCWAGDGGRHDRADVRRRDRMFVFLIQRNTNRAKQTKSPNGGESLSCISSISWFQSAGRLLGGPC